MRSHVTGAHFCGMDGIRNLCLACLVRDEAGIPGADRGVIPGQFIPAPWAGLEPPHPAGSTTVPNWNPCTPPQPLSVCLSPPAAPLTPLPPGLEELGSGRFICPFHVTETFLASSLALTGVGDWSPGPRWGPNIPLWLPSALVNLETPASRNHQSRPASQFRHQQPISASAEPSGGEAGSSPLTPAVPRPWYCTPPCPHPSSAHWTPTGRRAPPARLCLAALDLSLVLCKMGTSATLGKLWVK